MPPLTFTLVGAPCRGSLRAMTVALGARPGQSVTDPMWMFQDRNNGAASGQVRGSLCTGLSTRAVDNLSLTMVNGSVPRETLNFAR